MTINLLDAGFVGSLPVPSVPPPTGDPDAVAYMIAVEAADGQALENAVRTAINNYVVAIKAIPGIWAGLNIIAPMAGPRTLAGCMVPLKGAPPFTATNVTSGDYSRSTGLVHSKALMPVTISNTSYNATGPNFVMGVSMLNTNTPSPGTAGTILAQTGEAALIIFQSFDVQWDRVSLAIRGSQSIPNGWGWLGLGMNYVARISSTQVRWRFNTGFQGWGTAGNNVIATNPTSAVTIYPAQSQATNIRGMCFAVDILGSPVIDSTAYRDACLAYRQALINAGLP